MHEHAWFVTATYSNEHLPDNYSLNKRHHQLFMKRLRERFDTNIRFVMCGEYGKQTLRPHYHYILFGLNFSDLSVYRRSLKGHIIYTSEILTGLWKLGHVSIAPFSRQTGSYLAGYITKAFKSSDEEANAVYFTRIHPLTGEEVRVMPEFLLASRKPGIGLPWFEKYGQHLPYDDFIIVDGAKRPVPPYFLKKLPEELVQSMKQRRKTFAATKAADNTESRLISRHEKAQLDDGDKPRNLD